MDAQEREIPAAVSARSLPDDSTIVRSVMIR
jgi:hypothetical protein